MRRWRRAAVALEHDGGGVGLVPHPHEALDGRERREGQHHPEDGDEQDRDQQAEAQQDDALGTLHEPALGLEAQRLGLGPLVADERGQPHDGHGQHGQDPTVVGREEPRHATEQQHVGDTVGHGVEVRPPLAGGAGGLGQGAVEHVGQCGQDDQDEPGQQVARTDGDRGGHGEHQTGHGELVRREPRAPEGVAHRLHGPLDGSPEPAVEHGLQRYRPRVRDLVTPRRWRCCPARR